MAKKKIKVALIIDMQHDFIADDGALKVEGGQEALANTIKRLGDTQYDFIYFTADSHPFDHCSFKENGGIWSRHCVKNTIGASIPIQLIEAAHKGENIKKVEILTKGCGSKPTKIIEAANLRDNKDAKLFAKRLNEKVYSDEYSFLQDSTSKNIFNMLFMYMETAYGIPRMLKEDGWVFNGDFEIDVMGIAGDFCVLNTIIDLVKEGFHNYINVICDCIASIDGGKALSEYCHENNIKMI